MNYLGFLTNIDSSILLLDLDEDFKIKKEKISDVSKIVSKFYNTTEKSFTDLLSRNHIEPDEYGNYIPYIIPT